MNSASFKSQYVLIDSITASDPTASQFGQKLNWVGTDIFSSVSNLTSPFITNDFTFSDGAYFDGGNTEFGELNKTYSQKIDFFQILKTNKNWVNSTEDILKSTIIKTIPITGTETTDVIYSGAIDNFFIADAGNPYKAIKIFNNQTLSHGWAIFTSQQKRIDSGSISRAWIYDSITRIKLADLEVVDLYAGILPGTIESQLDFICDIDPAIYNIPLWIPGNNYIVGNRVLYGGQTYQALYTGKSGSIFNSALWTLIPPSFNTNSEGNIKWDATQIGKTWFKTAKLKVINAQLGTLSERAQNWNTWFPNVSIEVYEWINSSVPPASFTSNTTNGFILDLNCPYTYDPSTQQYGFWVFGKDSLGPIHTQTTKQLINDIENIPNAGIPIITAIDTNAVAVWNINQFVSSNTVILHIDYINESANNQIHNEFSLISNDGSKSWYNTTIYPKFVDSLSGVSETNQLVPDYTLPTQQQAGILNNPVQSLFVNRVTALDIYFSVVNAQIANLAIATSSIISALSASDPLPITGFNEQIPDRNVLNELDPSLYPANYRILLTEDDTLSPVQWTIVANVDGSWQISQHQLYNLVNNWKYADWYASNYTSSTPTYVLNNLGELSLITYKTGDVVQILNNGNGNEAIYLGVQNDIDPAVIELNPIYIQDGTIQFLPNLYDFLNSEIGFDNQGFDSQGFDNDPYLAIRLVTQILNDIIFVGSDTFTAAANNGFFSILKYIFYENENLDWLFKTSFVTVDYDNRNLNVRGTFQPDNQSSIEDFVNETLPFHTRIREFRDIYSSNDYANIGVVDFDLPAQYDSNYANIVYNFTSNPKLNTLLPLSSFQGMVGVASDSSASYITSSGIPANPTMPSIIQDWKFGLVTNPITTPIKYNTVPNTMGPIAVAIDGVPFFSPNSGTTETLYLYGNIAYPLANVNTYATYTFNSVWSAQQESLDPGAGFTNEQNEYQYLTNPYIMANVAIGIHSPIIGYAWDGNPIYGPYGYANANGSGGIIINTSSYQLSSNPRLDKTGQPFINGLQMAVYALPTGEYIEDFIYVPNLGTLDESNGRYVVTPEYPNGVYAYFASVTPANVSIPSYPYIIGPCYNSKPFGLKYVYVDGINTPVYPNGNVTIPLTPTIQSVDLIRSPDGSIPSDQLTLLQPVYTPWGNNHTYSIENLIVERPGAGYINLLSDIIITPTNNANANVSSLQVVSSALVSGGNNYSNGEIIALIGGIYSNVATIQVTNVNVSTGNSITSFTMLPTVQQLLPITLSNIFATSIDGNGSNAIFDLKITSDSILPTLINGGNNYVNGKFLTLSDGNYGNVAIIQISNVNIASNNSITSFTMLPTTYQGYTSVPSNIANVSTLSLSGNGYGATFNVTFGLESIFISQNGNNFTYTPTITIIDANATTPATIYPELENDLVRQMNTTLVFDRTGNTEYTDVFVNAGEFTSSYSVPSGTIFDSNDATAGQNSLNISWRPELISDTSLSTEYSRFGNTAGVFSNETNQYIIANIVSPDLDTLRINSNNFTLEFFMNFSNLSNNLSVMVDTRANITSTSGLVVFRNGSNLCVGSNTNVAIISNNILPFVTNEWEYITIQGNNGNLYSYMNGQLLKTANISYDYSDYNLTLGADVSGSNVSIGYMDEIRLTVQHNRYTPGIINIDVPTQAFPRSLATDPYLISEYTPLLWGFENFVNEGEPNITFVSVNSQTLISDLSWNQKKLQLINYGTNLVIDSSTINTINNPQTSEILAVKLNQG